MYANDISLTLDGDVATLALTGEHEAYSADKLARQLDGLLTEGVPICVDLRRAEFVDSTVVGTLLAASRRADAAGLAFRLVLGETTGWPVRRLLDITGLVREFDIDDSSRTPTTTG
jgi:anti-anti-sigma factor